MALQKKQEIYAQLVAEGIDDLEAMAQAGYKAKDERNAKRQLRNLQENDDVQNRINELKAIKRVQNNDMTNLDNEKAEVVEIVNALHFFQTIYKNPRQPLKARINCASIAIQYEEQKLAQVGKKEQTKNDAVQATQSGKFATMENQVDIFSSEIVIN